MITITAVRWEKAERDPLVRVLERSTGVLFEEPKRPRDEPRDRVAKHLHRIRQRFADEFSDRLGEPYFERDLRDLRAVLTDLIAHWEPASTEEFWRSAGAPGSEASIYGLAREGRIKIDGAREALGVVDAAIEMVSAAGLVWKA